MESSFGNTADGAAYPLFKDLLSLLGLANKQVREKYFEAGGEYQRRYKDRHGILKVLGMREPVSLDEVYTAVQILDSQEVKYFESPEALELFHWEKGNRLRSGSEQKKKPGISVANEKQYLMVLGGPGIGKSTFLRKMGLEALKGRHEQGYKHNCVPVLIELRRFENKTIDIFGAIINEFEICGFPNPQGFAKAALAKGKLLVMLDGLDEVPTEQFGDVVVAISNFVDQYQKNRYIASCRIAAYRHNFKRFTDVTIADFDDNQIRQFVGNWFKDEPERGRKCWERLSNKENEATKELAHTPLLLTLLCLQYRHAGGFPAKRATLYKRALLILLEEWEAEKELPRQEIYKGMDAECKEVLLAQVAHDAFQKNRLFMDKDELEKQIKQGLEELLPDEKKIDGRAVLGAIEVQHGLLAARVEGIYSFSHLTFQEFLTARYIIDEQDRMDALVSEHLLEDRWREVFLLVGGLRKADYLLGQMAKQAQTLLNIPKLKALIRWSDEITASSASDEKPVTKRIILVAFYLALVHSHSRDINRDIAFTMVRAMDLAGEFTVTLVSSCNLESTQEIEQAQICVDVDFTRLSNQLESLDVGVKELLIKRQQIWLSALRVPAEVQSLCLEEAQFLRQYFDAYNLIVQCKKAAVHVSSQRWAEIENSFLTVPPE